MPPKKTTTTKKSTTSVKKTAAAKNSSAATKAKTKKPEKKALKKSTPKVASKAASTPKIINAPKTKGHFYTSQFVLSVIFASFITSLVIFTGLTQFPQYFSLGSSSVSDQAIEEGIQRFIEKQEQLQKDQAAKQEQAQAEQVKGVSAVSKDDHIKGDLNAPISIIEFSDYECPFCKRNHPVVQKVLDNYGENVNWVYRHLPLPFHNPNATDQAEASECVAELGGNEAFWLFTDALYERTKSNKGFAFSSIQPLAEEFGINGEDFAACMDSDKHLVAIEADQTEAASLGISGTPANLIRNNITGEVKLLGGAYPYESFTEIIDNMLQ